jgi:phage-related protein
MKETDTTSLAILAASMLLLALAFKAIASLSIGNIIAGLVAIGGALTILIIAAAAAQEVIPGLLALGGAILLIGAGFALIGVGADLLAIAFETFAKYGSQAIDVAKKLVMAMAGLIPTIAQGFATGFIDFAKSILSQLPDLIKQFVVVAAAALKGLTDLLPEITKFVSAAIDSILTLFKDKSPAIITAGIEFILNLLDGIRKNTDKVTKLGADIIIDFINGLRTKVGGIVTASADLLIAFLNGVSQKLPEIIASGTALVVNFLNGVAAAIGPIAEAAKNLVVNLINGIATYVVDVSTAGANLIIAFIEGLGANALRIVDAAFNTVITFLEGLATSIKEHRGELLQAGIDVLSALFDGITTTLTDVKNWFLELPGKILGWIGDAGTWLLDVGTNIIHGLWDGLKGAKDWLLDKIGWLVNLLPGFIKDIFGIESPSKVFAEIGHYLTLGMAEGVSSNKSRLALRTSAEVVADEVVKSFAPDQKQITETAQKSFENSLKQISLADMSIDTTPIIAPVLDLTNIQKDSSKISTMLGAKPLTANVSTQQASSLAIATTAQQDTQATVQPTATEIKFEQNVYAPTALSVGDIYRQTKNQITMAKEELSIL